MKLTTKRAIQIMMHYLETADRAKLTNKKTLFGKSVFEKYWDKAYAQLDAVVQVAIDCGDLEEPPTAANLVRLLLDFATNDKEFEHKIYGHAVTIAAKQCGVPHDQVKNFLTNLAK